MITEFSDLDTKGVVAAINDMIDHGEFPVLTTMQVMSAGGIGTVMPGGGLPLINGKSLAVVGQTQVFVPAYAMGCPACPHPLQGVFVTGANMRFCNGAPVVVLSSTGLLSGACGPPNFQPSEALYTKVSENDVVSGRF